MREALKQVADALEELVEMEYPAGSWDAAHADYQIRMGDGGALVAKKAQAALVIAQAALAANPELRLTSDGYLVGGEPPPEPPDRATAFFASRPMPEPTDAAMQAVYQAAAPEALAWPWDAGLRAVYEAGRAAAAPVAPTGYTAKEWEDAKLRGIASDYFPDAKEWPAAMRCMQHLLMEQRKTVPVAPVVQPALGDVEALRHSANEWADMATNGLQWLRNIVQGISDPAEALSNMEECLGHCRSVNDSDAVQRAIIALRQATAAPAAQPVSVADEFEVRPAGPSSTACDDQWRTEGGAA